MIRTEQKVIDGSVYTATQFPARYALRLKAKLIKIFGSPLTQILFPEGKPLENILDYELKKDDIVKAIPLLFENLDEKTFDSLIIEILSGVRKEGVELTANVIDLEFSGELHTLYKVIWFVIELNYGSFWKRGITGSQ